MSPRQLDYYEDPTTPYRANIEVDGKKANLPINEGKQLFLEYRALMDEVTERVMSAAREVNDGSQ